MQPDEYCQLVRAVQSRRLGTVRYLLEQGVKPNALAIKIAEDNKDDDILDLLVKSSNPPSETCL